MTDYRDKVYDVAIRGGGPAGSTLAARLARETELAQLKEQLAPPQQHLLLLAVLSDMVETSP
jgi:flavin-dependent dehydrogenase